MFCLMSLAGYVYEATGDYDMSFHIGGGVLIVTGALFCILHLPYFTKRKLANAEESAMMQVIDPNIPLPESTDDEEDDEEAFEHDHHHQQQQQQQGETVAV